MRWAALPAFLLGLLLAFAGGAATSAASDLDLGDAEELFHAGRYDECARMAAREMAGGFWSERWAHWKARSELARGKSAEAIDTLRLALRRFPASVALRWLSRDAHRAAGRDAEAAAELEIIERIVLGMPQRFATPEGRVLLGRFVLERGADARKVLDQFYDVARKEQPDLVEAYLATAELALEKGDDALAAETLQKAPKDAAEDPRYHYLLARAFSSGDRERSEKSLDDALKINPRHADSLLLRADHLIDAERYDEADPVLARALDVDPHEPRAFAYRAVLAHLRNDPAGEADARASALSPRSRNPEVDRIIGRKLAQKYRFAEGTAALRRSLAIDPEYQPAKVELCQALLRLGEEDEGWALAGEIFARDGYNVVAYNLVTLRDRVRGFRTLEGDGFLLRMDPREADLYGARALDLLKRAKQALCDRYGATPRAPVIVEIFPQRKEFAVRTFGLPGAEGFLGVCFGRVITANSPASQGETPANWESVLWHEFCHAVTLEKTRNKMPRWLSEGISVYEEGRRDPACAEPPNPRFRAMLLGKELTPLSRLSSAFLSPESPVHLQFAYYESALVVDFLVSRFGFDALTGLLDDLGAGKTINEALPERTKTTLVQLDEDFARFAHRHAEGVAPGASWEEPELPPDADAKALSAWLEKHPGSFYGRQRLAARLVAEEDWPRAIEALEGLKTLYPEYVGPENAYVLLANVYRKTSRPAAERAALEELSTRDGDAAAAYLRLLELDEAAGDWEALARDARRLLAVNPLIPAPHRALARAAEQLGRRAEALEACRALVLLDDGDPAGLHYRLARLLHQEGRPAEARREVLKSLEDAPRFLDAHRLLLDLVGPAEPDGHRHAP